MPSFDLPTLPLPRDVRDTPYIGSYDSANKYTVPSSQWFKNASNLWVPVSAANPLPVDTELPAAAALADGAVNPTVPMVGVAKMRYNGTTFDRERGNHNVTVLADEARTEDTESADQVNYNCLGMFVLIDVTAAGSPTPGCISSFAIQRKVGSNYSDIYKFSGVNISAVGQYDFLVFPGATSQGELEAAPISGPVPRDWRLSVINADQVSEITYGVTVGYVKG